MSYYTEHKPASGFGGVLKGFKVNSQWILCLFLPPSCGFYHLPVFPTRRLPSSISSCADEKWHSGYSWHGLPTQPRLAREGRKDKSWPLSHQRSRGARDQGGKNDHNEAFKLLGLDTMQETLVVTLRNSSWSFPREAQCHRVMEAGQTDKNKNNISLMLYWFCKIQPLGDCLFEICSQSLVFLIYKFLQMMIKHSPNQNAYKAA